MLPYVYIIVGDEVGEQGTHHHQGYIFFKNARAFGGVKDILPPGCHIEAAKGTPMQNKEYCSKQGILYEDGTIPIQGKRNDLATVKQMIAEGATMSQVVDAVDSYQAIRGGELILKYKEQPRSWVPTVYWFWGPTGAGKTRTAAEMAPNAWWSGKSLRWWDGYDAHEDVIIDDFRGDFCTFHELLRILDRYEYRIEVKGGSRQLRARRIFITSPYSPKGAYPNCGEQIAQLLRRISEVRAFPPVDT